MLAASNNKFPTNTLLLIEQLELESRWVIIGTPAAGLYCAEVAMASDHRLLSSKATSLRAVQDILEKRKVENSAYAIEQEKKDIQKLGSIARFFLNIQPWNNDPHEDRADWNQYVLLKRHGNKSYGTPLCLRAVLEGMVLRHRPEDVDKDVQLPPLSNKLVYLDRSFQDTLSINIFALVIITNAVTSEREDADFLFHYRNKKSLAALVNNLRQASFLWTGFSENDIKSTIYIAKGYLEKKNTKANEQDLDLLRKAIAMGELALSNPIYRATSKYHELAFMIEGFPADACRHWALDGTATNDGSVLMGATQLLQAQKCINLPTESADPMDYLITAGITAMDNANRDDYIEQNPPKKTEKERTTAAQSIGKNQRSGPSSVTHRLISNPAHLAPSKAKKYARADESPGSFKGDPNRNILKTVSSKATRGRKKNSKVKCPINPALLEAKILSTTSAKMSYLLHQIFQFYKEEKILVFYEHDNTAVRG